MATIYFTSGKNIRVQESMTEVHDIMATNHCRQLHKTNGKMVIVHNVNIEYLEQD